MNYQKKKSNLLLSSILEPNHSGLPKSIYITIQDSISQSALPIINQIIKSFSKFKPLLNQNDNLKLLIIGLNYNPIIFKKYINENQRIQFIDLSSIDNEEEEEINIEKLLELIECKLNPIQVNSSITIIIDSLIQCIKKWSIKQTLNLFNQLLNKYQSKLIVIDSPHLYPPQETSIHSTINVSKTFTSSSFIIQSNSIQLKIYPTKLYHHLIQEFQIPLPKKIQKDSKIIGTNYDFRLVSLLDELNSTMNPFEFNSILIPQALLIPPTSSVNHSTGSCLIGWTTKNLSTSLSFESTSLNLNLSDSKKKTNSSVLHGIEAFKLDCSLLDSNILELIPVSIEELSIKPNRLNLKSSSQQIDSMNELNQKVTFNLSITEKQRIDRDQVQLPFLPKRNQQGIVIEAPGEIYDGSFHTNSSSKASSNGLILYEPDSADDMDEEEPDDEL